MSLNEWQLSGLDVSSWNDRNWGVCRPAAFDKIRIIHWTSVFVRAWLLVPHLSDVTRRPPLLSDPRLGSVEELDTPAPILET